MFVVKANGFGLGDGGRIWNRTVRPSVYTLVAHRNTASAAYSTFTGMYVAATSPFAYVSTLQTPTEPLYAMSQTRCRSIGPYIPSACKQTCRQYCRGIYRYGIPYHPAEFATRGGKNCCQYRAAYTPGYSPLSSSSKNIQQAPTGLAARSICFMADSSTLVHGASQKSRLLHHALQQPFRIARYVVPSSSSEKVTEISAANLHIRLLQVEVQHVQKRHQKRLVLLSPPAVQVSESPAAHRHGRPG